MSGYALFAPERPVTVSLLTARTTDRNLPHGFKIGRVPIDTQMRTLLDEVETANLRRLPAAASGR